jgi:hypothetical protein
MLSLGELEKALMVLLVDGNFDQQAAHGELIENARPGLV